MKRLITKMALFVFLTTATMSMAQNPITILAPNYINPIGYPLPLPTQPGGYQGQKAECASNAFPDAQGNLKFFVVDNEIYDYAGYHIGTMDGATSYYAKGRSEITIVKDPANCERFYLFTISRNYTNGFAGDEYIKVTLDFSQPSAITPTRMGYSEAVTIPGFEARSKNGNGHWAASKMRTDNSHLIFCSEQNKLHVFYMDESGTNPGTTNFQLINSIETPLLNDTESTEVRAELEINETHVGQREYRVAMPFYVSNPYVGGTAECIMVVDLDNFGNEISASKRLIVFPIQLVNNQHVPFIHGLEFDETGNYLFIAHSAGNSYTTGLSYVDLSIPGNITAVPLNLPGNLDYQNSQIETMTINGTKGLYMATQNSMGRLLVNYATSSIQLQNNVLSYGVAASYMTLDMLPNWDNYPDYKCYLLPDQVDGFDYSEFYVNNSTDLNCCKQNSFFNKETFTATTNGTWQPGFGNNPLDQLNDGINVVTIRDELRIPKGKTISIKNMEIRFAPGARLVIENGDASNNGGVLVLDNTKLTVDTRCSNDELWRGIEVWGVSNKEQQEAGAISKQGKLYVKNNSLIEHAVNAVVLGAYNATSSTYDLTKSGGIVNAENATFRNNQRDISWKNYIAPSGSNNLSLVKTCLFLTDAPLKSGVLPINHLDLQYVKGITILGCTFKNTEPTLMQKSNGIFASNSSFFANALCTSPGNGTCTNYIPNTFQNLRNGIYVSNSISALAFSSERNEFIDNVYGVWANGSYLASITRNNFKVFESANPSDKTVGVRLVGCTKYVVEENNFNVLAPVPNPSSQTYGIVVDNSGTESNLIYRNNFDKLAIGGQSQRINAYTATGNATGLVWKCNTFKNPIGSHDLAVVNGNIAYNQGYMDPSSLLSATQKAANNQFSQVSEGMALAHDVVLSNSEAINYVYTSSGTTTPDSYTSSYMSIQQSTFLSFPVYFNFLTGCPSKLDRSRVVLNTSLALLRQKLNTNQEKYENGSSSSLQNIVTNGSNGAKKNALLAASPYISESILIQYIQANPPVGHLQQVLIANSPLTPNVITALTNSSIPTAVKNSILILQNGGLSPRIVLEQDIAYTNENIYRNTDDLLREVLLDTTKTRDFQDAIAILQSQPEKIYREMLLNIRLLQRNTTEATDILDTIGQYGRTQELNLMRIEMEENNQNISEYFSSNQVALQELYSISDDSAHCICASRAYSMLCELNGYLYQDSIYDIVMSQARGASENQSTPVTPSSISEFGKNYQFEVYPNPTTGIAVLNNYGVEGYVNIFNPQGQRVATYETTNESTVLDLSSLDKGYYLIQLVDKEFHTVYTQKVVLK